MRSTLLLATLSVLFAGCVQASSNATPAPEERLVDLHGFVVDVELRPLEDVRVEIQESNATATTDAAGRFVFTRLAPGVVTLHVAHDGFEPLSRVVDLTQAIDAIDLRLVPLPAPTAHTEPFLFRGSFDCGFEFAIIGQDCLVLYENVTGEKDPVTQETNAFRMLVKPDWETIYLNLTWDMGAENQLDGMRLNFEHGNGSTTGHAYQIAQVGGSEQPLELFVTRGEPHPTADVYDGTETYATLADEGEETQVRVFPRGKFSEEFGQVCSEPRKCFLGVGAAIDINFEVNALVYYSK